MIDYSRAASSKAAKESVDNAADKLISEIQGIKEEYHNDWNKVEELRKSRAAEIEHIIPILKTNEVKLARPLSRCNNDEIIEELGKVVDSLPFAPQEEVRVAMIRIDGRYKQIVEQGKKLDKLYEKLSNYYVPEQDFEDEVVVSIKNRKKKTATKEETKLDDKDQVVAVEPANEGLIISLNEILNSKRNTVDYEKVLDEEEANITNLLFHNTEDQDLPELEGIEFQTCKLKANQTFAEIVDYVYDGKLSWYDIYRYGHNQEVIDQRCAELRLDPEYAAYEEGVLTGLDIEYPKNFITYEEIKPNHRGMGKAA